MLSFWCWLPEKVQHHVFIQPRLALSADENVFCLWRWPELDLHHLHVWQCHSQLPFLWPSHPYDGAFLPFTVKNAIRNYIKVARAEFRPCSQSIFWVVEKLGTKSCEPTCSWQLLCQWRLHAEDYRATLLELLYPATWGFSLRMGWGYQL